MKAAAQLAALALSLLACTEAQPPPATPAASIKSAPPASACPFGVPGARVAYEDTAGGAQLTLSAAPDQLDNLRQRVRDAAAMHGTGKRAGQGHDGRHETGGSHGLRPMQLPPARAGEWDLDGGARIELIPYDEADLPVLRAKLRQRASELMASCE